MSSEPIQEELPVTAIKHTSPPPESTLDSGEGIDVAAALGLHDNDDSPLPVPDMQSMDLKETVAKDRPDQELPVASSLPKSDSEAQGVAILDTPSSLGTEPEKDGGKAEPVEVTAGDGLLQESSSLDASKDVNRSLKDAQLLLALHYSLVSQASEVEATDTVDQLAKSRLSAAITSSSVTKDSLLASQANNSSGAVHTALTVAGGIRSAHPHSSTALSDLPCSVISSVLSPKPSAEESTSQVPSVSAAGIPAVASIPGSEMDHTAANRARATSAPLQSTGGKTESIAAGTPSKSSGKTLVSAAKVPPMKGGKGISVTATSAATPSSLPKATTSQVGSKRPNSATNAAKTKTDSSKTTTVTSINPALDANALKILSSLSTPSPTVPAVSSSAAANGSKMGVDMQLFQLLHANFPNLQLEAFKSIFQVNSLITQTLQQQQKQLQQQQKQPQQQNKQQLQQQNKQQLLLQQQRKQQQQQKLQQQISNVKAALKSSGVTIQTPTSQGKSQVKPNSSQMIKFGGKTVTNTTLKFTEDGIKGVEVGGGEGTTNPPTTSSSSSQGDSTGINVGATKVSLGSLGQTIKIGGRNVTNATLKLGEDGELSGIDIGTSSRPTTIKIGGDNSDSGRSTNLIMGKGGPVKVATLFPPNSTPSPGAKEVSSSSSPLTSSSAKVLSTAAATATTVTAGSKATEDKSRPPVFAQILANLKRQGGTIGSVVKNLSISTSSAPSSTSALSVVASKSDSPQSVSKATITLPGFTSPLVLSRQRDSSGTAPTILTTIPGLSSTQLVPVTRSSVPPTSGGATTASVAANAPSNGGSKRTAAKRQRAQLSQVLVDQEVATEGMELDVGKPLHMVELPDHLVDHTYSFYNPEEGEKVGPFLGRSAVVKSSRGASTIPPARVSYAPQVRVGGVGWGKGGRGWVMEGSPSEGREGLGEGRDEREGLGEGRERGDNVSEGGAWHWKGGRGYTMREEGREG